MLKATPTLIVRVALFAAITLYVKLAMFFFSNVNEKCFRGKVVRDKFLNNSNISADRFSMLEGVVGSTTSIYI